jgi:hypothetical protein
MAAAGITVSNKCLKKELLLLLWICRCSWPEVEERGGRRRRRAP